MHSPTPIIKDESMIKNILASAEFLWGICSNFHQFLNGYRIREACRLMRVTDPASTTVEYISETVGFKSRTSFASLFKKTTGLTPSEYWKMARKEPKEPKNTESDTE